MYFFFSFFMYDFRRVVLNFCLRLYLFVFIYLCLYIYYIFYIFWKKNFFIGFRRDSVGLSILNSYIDNQKKNYDTQYSHVVPHHSTDCAITSLTSEIGRDPVFSSVYGRNRQISFVSCYYTPLRYTNYMDIIRLENFLEI